MPLKSIVWLASYPKSGNTWTRVFLANYLLNPPEPLSINQVHRVGIGDAITEMYRMVLGQRFDPMDHVQHLKARERVLKGIVNNDADFNLVKTHNIKTKALGYELIVKRYSRAAVYIIRHPYDVVISYARHYGQTPEAAVRSISRGDNTTMGGSKNVKQYLGSWSEHVQSWVRTRDFPVHVLRYEDMQTDPHTAFGGMLDKLGIPLDDERLDRAIRFSSFDELQKQEAASGFVERSQNSERFFHTGTSGQWEGVLSEEDIAYMKEKHGATMLEYGYL